MGRGAFLAVAALTASAFVPVPTVAAASGPQVVATISLPGVQPLSLGVHEASNHLFVADDNSGDVKMIDGSTRQVVASTHVGGSTFQMVVNQTHGKVYVASEGGCCSTGINQGTHLIAVLNAQTGALITQIDLGPHGNYDSFVLENDEVHDKVYVTYQNGPFVIDAATDQVSPMAYGGQFFGAGVSDIDVNAVTNKVYYTYYGPNQLLVGDGPTRTIQPYDLGPTGGSGPLDLAVNEVENKVYVTMLHAPGHPYISILILDRDTGGFKFVGQEDLEPLVFNQQSNTLFSGVQVGQRGAIVNGATDELTYVDFDGAGMGGGDVRTSTDNAYFAEQEGTHVVNGATKLVQTIPTGNHPRGGLFAYSVAIDQSRGLVYVVNDDQNGKITVIQDGVIEAPDTTPPQTAIDSGPSSLIDDPTPTFSFSSDDPAATFQCRMDSGSFSSCTSPHTTASLQDGRHSFEVRARDVAGNTDPTPATRSFTVDTAPPQTTITGGPFGQTVDRTPTFRFRSSDPGSTYRCKLDGQSWRACASPKTYPVLGFGPHTFRVQARDQIGHTDPTPAKRSFAILRP